MPLAELSAAAAGLKHCYDLTKGLLSLAVTAEVQAKARELNEAILTAQASAVAAVAAQAALVDEVGALKAKVAEMENWDAERQRYELQEVAPGILAYRVKEAMRGSEPLHHICQNCYANRRRSHLQRQERGRMVSLRCDGCGASLELPY